MIIRILSTPSTNTGLSVHTGLPPLPSVTVAEVVQELRFADEMVVVLVQLSEEVSDLLMLNPFQDLL